MGLFASVWPSRSIWQKPKPARSFRRARKTDAQGRTPNKKLLIIGSATKREIPKEKNLRSGPDLFSGILITLGKSGGVGFHRSGTQVLQGIGKWQPLFGPLTSLKRLGSCGQRGLGG